MLGVGAWFLVFQAGGTLLDRHSFPTRRSSDLQRDSFEPRRLAGETTIAPVVVSLSERRGPRRQDRKSTRLNSSHLGISYAVFCLKKKKERCKGCIWICCSVPVGAGGCRFT